MKKALILLCISTMGSLIAMENSTVQQATNQLTLQLKECVVNGNSPKDALEKVRPLLEEFNTQPLSSNDIEEFLVNYTIAITICQQTKEVLQKKKPKKTPYTKAILLTKKQR